MVAWRRIRQPRRAGLPKTTARNRPYVAPSAPLGERRLHRCSVGGGSRSFCDQLVSQIGSSVLALQRRWFFRILAPVARPSRWSGKLGGLTVVPGQHAAPDQQNPEDERRDEHVEAFRRDFPGRHGDNYGDGRGDEAKETEESGLESGWCKDTKRTGEHQLAWLSDDRRYRRTQRSCRVSQRSNIPDPLSAVLPPENPPGVAAVARSMPSLLSHRSLRIRTVFAPYLPARRLAPGAARGTGPMTVRQRALATVGNRSEG